MLWKEFQGDQFCIVALTDGEKVFIKFGKEISEVGSLWCPAHKSELAIKDTFSKSPGKEIVAISRQVVLGMKGTLAEQLEKLAIVRAYLLSNDYQNYPRKLIQYALEILHNKSA